MIKVLHKAFDILEYVASEKDSCSLSRIAEAIGEKPTTVSNIVQTLLKRDYLERDGKGLYRLGIRAYILAGSTPEYDSILCEISEAPLREVVKDVQADGVISVFRNRKKYIVLRILSDSLVRVSPSVYGNTNPCSTETGLVLLAYQKPDTIRQVAASCQLPPFCKDEGELFRLLERIRKEGFFMSFSSERLRAAAAPLYCGREVVSAIGLYQPRFEESQKADELMKTRILETANIISKGLTESMKQSE